MKPTLPWNPWKVTLRLGPRFTLSNGQAWNWSPFPDAYLDARTLSFPTR